MDRSAKTRKRERFTILKTECQRVIGDGVSTYSAFGLFDGHNGFAAAMYSKENLLNNVLLVIPPELGRASLSCSDKTLFGSQDEGEGQCTGSGEMKLSWLN